MRKKTLIMIGACLAFSLIWIFRPYEKPDMEQVIPEIQAMEEPFKDLGSAYFLDGGTIGILIIDNKGEKLMFSLPAPLGEEDDQYQRLFIGALHYTDEGAREIANPRETKIRLAEILRNNPKPDRYGDIALAEMTERWSDYWRIIRRIWITKEYEKGT